MTRNTFGAKPLNTAKTPLALACAMLLAMPAVAAEIKGQVVDSTGAAIQGAPVKLAGTSRIQLSDASGEFTFSNLAAGDYQLQAGTSSSVVEQIQLSAEQVYQTSVTLADANIEHVSVIGQSGALSRSLSAQRNADNFITVSSADAIGEFPDSNAAESLQRMAGLSIERDQGEGRFVRVRGLSPDLNAVTYNGSTLPAPESGTRAVALDVIPSDLLESLTVTKTLTPDMDADSLGGAVDIKSLSAFDKEGRFTKLTAEGSFDEHESEYGNKLAATYSDRYAIGGADDDFGIALAASNAVRKFGSDNVETGGKWDIGDEDLLEKVQLRDYQIERERLGLAANFDWRPDDNNSLYLRTLYSRFSDQESRNAIATKFDDGLALGAADQTAEVSRELKHRKETQTIKSFVLGSDSHIDDWKLSTQFGWSEAEEKNPHGISGATFEGEFDQGVSYSSYRKPVLTGAADFYDAAQYELKEIEVESTDAKDRNINGRLDISRNLYLNDTVLELKAGGKFSRRQKTNQETHWVYEDLDEQGLADDALLMSAYAGDEVDYGLGAFGPSISPNSIQQMLGTLDAADNLDELESTINDYRIDEDVNAAYLMATSDWGDLRMVAGLRYEKTELTGAGWEFSELSDSYSERHVSHDYDNLLPSIQFRYGVDSNLVLRAAWTNSLVRPTFEQVSPGYLLEGSLGELEASFGNPQLKPLESSNYDIAAEYYMGESGILSAALFYKNIKNFIYEADLAGRDGYEDFDEANTYINGDSSKLYGAEFNFAQKLDMLPSPWNGLLFSANLTLSHSEASISWLDDGELQSRDIRFPSQSNTTGNIAVGYENEYLSLRLSAAYKSNYMTEVGELDDANYDIYQQDHMQIDFIAKGFVSKDIMVYFKALNINDEPYYTYTGNERRNAQFEDYGPTYQIGINISGF
ncbi:TonB-dependent receptor [Shewanella avicenniae]|uniref:TonB-dependent receptor n=1 Tax=Shewanella avicenniae TaxID=2814294 RepID=A0ABX7QTS8_9GAMM|nr:TonB-dependent receptor [Shewanella avicenniae]QSX34243.1 TonB-dependent receptor [Shewanella avicenniae]